MTRVGRPPITSRVALLAAAREVGFQDAQGRVLSVGAVTRGVGVKYSTFYRHFPSIDDLVSAMAEDVLSTVEFPEPVGLAWDRYLREVAVRLHNVLIEHPGMAEAIQKLNTWPDSLVKEHARAEQVLAVNGFGPQDDLPPTAAQLVDAVFWTVLRLPPGHRLPAVDMLLVGAAAG